MNKVFLEKKEENTSVKEFISKINKSDAKRRLIPQELRWGWPSVSIKKGELCLTIPYYGLSRVPDNGKFYLFPIAYTITVIYRNGKIIDFKCLLYNKDFKDVDFNKPCGVFPHEALADFTAADYKEKRSRLFDLYDEMISCLINKQNFEGIQEMQSLFTELMEPGHYPFYKQLAPKFFSNYCNL